MQFEGGKRAVATILLYVGQQMLELQQIKESPLSSTSTYKYDVLCNIRPKSLWALPDI